MPPTERTRSVYVDDIELGGQKQNIDPMWKVLNKEVDLGEPTYVLDHVYLGCTQRKCEISKDIVDNYRAMFESRISVVKTEKLPYSKNFRISAWSYDMVGHAKKCVERYCELANKTTQQLYKVSTPCIDDHDVDIQPGLNHLWSTRPFCQLRAKHFAHKGEGSLPQRLKQKILNTCKRKGQDSLPVRNRRVPAAAGSVFEFT